MVELIDDNVGRMLAALEETGQLERTGSRSRVRREEFLMVVHKPGTGAESRA